MEFTMVLQLLVYVRNQLKENIAIVEKFINTEAFCDSITAVALKVLCSSSYGI